MPREERQKFLGITVKETERLTRLINQVLDLAKIEAGDAEWAQEYVDLQEVLGEALVATSQLFLDKSVKLEKQIPSQPVFVMADRDRLVQVVINLVSNAVKFCANDSGRVRIRLGRVKGDVRMEVTDNGPGIPREEQERIFEKFHQLKGPQDEKPKGSGLGLAICQRIIEYYGGRIWVESQPGMGATFALTLPSAAAGPAESIR
jgi:signal transduction histidine kinase